MRVLELIKKYTWALPSDTQKEICDLSLYDHLKTTSAIATASYNYHMEEKGSLERITQASINDGKNQKHFLLVAGDVSGIQKYIYSLVNSKNIAKRLRARSFFIKILTEIASIKIIKELNLTISNIVISNGGKFYIIAQNSEVTRKKLKEIKNQINKELYDEYEGEIFLNLKGTELTGEELGIKFSEKFDKINDLLEKGKNKKFHKEILENPVINDSLYGSGEKVDLCPICGKYLKAKNKDSCQKCKRDEYWGTNLPTMENIAIYEGETSEADRISLFGFNAKILKENETVEGVPYLVINFGKSSGIEDLYPTCTENYGGYIPTKDGEVMSFNEIAQESKSRNLGILKGDIDDLGMIFSMGLKMEDEDEEQKKIKDVTSISRVATLSRMIDVFFSNWIPKVLKEKQEELGSHYVVYAGGDDFMIVGAWDKLLDVAKLIQEEFQRFVGKNPNFTISMGLAITKERDPIYLSSKWATELEGVAKSSGKNGIAIFDTYIPWGRYKEVFEFGEFLIKLREKYGISQSFIYRLLDYTSRAEKYQETKNSKYLSYLSHFEYDMARNIYSKLENKKDGGEVKSKLLKYFGYKGFIDKKDMEFLCSYMRVAINYAVRKVREV
jgi:CRISPR-associated protein Csm1